MEKIYDLKGSTYERFSLSNYDNITEKSFEKPCKDLDFIAIEKTLKI